LSSLHLRRSVCRSINARNNERELHRLNDSKAELVRASCLDMVSVDKRDARRTIA